MTAHTDHPLRHYDRTCPGCNEEQQQGPMLADMVEADFEKDTLTFRMKDDYRASAGEYVIVPLALYERLIAQSATAEMARDAERYRWLVHNIEMLPYPDTWAGKEWLDAEIDKRSTDTPVESSS